MRWGGVRAAHLRFWHGCPCARTADRSEGRDPSMSDAKLRRQSSNASTRPGELMDMSLPTEKKAKEEEKLPKPAR